MISAKKCNKGELSELRVNIETGVLEAFQKMSRNTGIPLSDLVVIALKRFHHHHMDYERMTPGNEGG